MAVHRLQQIGAAGSGVQCKLLIQRVEFISVVMKLAWRRAGPLIAVRSANILPLCSAVREMGAGFHVLGKLRGSSRNIPQHPDTGRHSAGQEYSRSERLS